MTKLIGHRLGYQIPFNTYLLKNVISIHRENPINVLHIHDANSGFASTICRQTLGIPYVCTIHNELRSAFTIRACDRVLAVSSYLKKTLVEQRGLSANKVIVLPVAIDSDLFKPTKSPQESKRILGLQDHPVVLFMGRKFWEKGPQILVDALPRITKNHPRVLAVLVGPDDFFAGVNTSFTDFLKRKAKMLGVSGNVVFQGFASDEAVRDYYNAADVFVCPSIWQDPSPQTIKEAQAYYKPVVASNVGGIPDMITPGFNGLLVPSKDPIALAEAVNALLDDREYALRLGVNGRKVVEGKFSLQATYPKCLEIYRSIQ